MTDQLRPGQRLIAYASLIKDRSESQPPSEFESWLWNLSHKEFDKAMKWSPE